MKNKIYILIPVVALALFAGIFVLWSARERVAAAQRDGARRAEQIARRETEEAARKAAFAESIAITEKRRAARAEREARRKADESARAELLDQRDAVAVQVGTARRELAELGKNIEDARDAVAALQAVSRGLASDKKALAELAAKAAANQAGITALLNAPVASATPAAQR